MFGVPALCEIGGRGLVPRQHSAISTDAPDEVGAFVVADAPLVVCFASLLSFCPQGTLEDTFADMLEVAPVGATSIIFNATGWVTFADMSEVATVGAASIFNASFLAMGILSCLLSARAMLLQFWRSAKFCCARSVQW